MRFKDVLAEPVRNGLYKPKRFHGHGTKIINMGELFANPRLGAVEMRRLEVTADELERFEVVPGDLLFARRSLVAEGAGKCTIVKDVSESTVFESSLIRARPDPSAAVSDFLFYFFSSPAGYRRLQSILRQVAVSGITGSDLAELPVPLPSIDEQRRIAGVLGALDDKVEHNRQVGRRLSDVLGALFRRLVSEAVERVPLGDQVEVIMGQSPPGASYSDDSRFGLPLVQGMASFGERFPQTDVFTSAPTKRTRPGDVLMTVRAPVGEINVADREFCAGRGVAVIRGRRGAYVEQLMRYLQPSWLEHEAGTIYPSVNRSQIVLLDAPKPSEDEVDRFEAEARPLYELIGVAGRERARLTAIRDSLLPKLVSGKLRVPESYTPA